MNPTYPLSLLLQVTWPLVLRSFKNGSQSKHKAEMLEEILLRNVEQEKLGKNKSVLKYSSLLKEIYSAFLLNTIARYYTAVVADL